MGKIGIGVVLFFMFAFIACDKEEEVVLLPNTNTGTIDTVNLPLLNGLYFGKHSDHYTSPSGSSSNGTDSVYAIVDTTGLNEYRFIICEDSLLAGIIYDTIDINLQNQPLKPCDEGPEYYNQSLPGGVIHNVILVLTTCDSIYVNRDYHPSSSHSGTGVSFSGKKLH